MVVPHPPNVQPTTAYLPSIERRGVDHLNLPDQTAGASVWCSTALRRRLSMWVVVNCAVAQGHQFIRLLYLQRDELGVDVAFTQKFLIEVCSTRTPRSVEEMVRGNIFSKVRNHPGLGGKGLETTGRFKVP